MQIDDDRLITSPKGDYAGGRESGLADARIFRDRSEEWYEALKDATDLTEEVRGYRDGLKEGLDR